MKWITVRRKSEAWSMKIVIAADRAGFAHKELLLPHLKALGYEVIDVGMKKQEEPLMWHIGCRAAVKLLQEKKAEKGILICGSGAGMALLANKYEGIFAVPCESPYTAMLARRFLDANVLTMGGYVIGTGQSEMIVDTFLNTSFCEGESPERVNYLIEQRDELWSMDHECFERR